MTMDDTRAQKVTQDIEKIGFHDGDQQALQLLRKDMQDYAATHTGNQTREYWQQLNKDLSTAGLLPGLEIEWGEDAQRKHGDLTRDRLQEVAGGNDPLEAKLASGLNQQFDTVKEMSNDKGFWDFLVFRGEPDKLTKDDLDKALSAQDQRVAGHSAAKDLLANQNGQIEGTLFSQIDALPGGKADGHIDKDDFDRAVAAINSGSLKVSDSQKNWINYIDQHWNDDSVRSMRENGDGNITARSLASAMGYSDVDQALAADQTSPTPTRTANTRTTR
jgi:hypothetical protein